MSMYGGEGRPVEVDCDGPGTCPVTWRGSELSPRAALEAIKRAGWSVAKRGAVWVHLCPACRAEEARSRGKGLF